MIKHFGYGLVFLCCSTGCGSTPEVERGGTSTSDSLTRTATIGTLSPKLRIGGRGKPTKPRPVDMVARPCRDDLFFVDLTLATQTPNGTAVGVAKATEELETEANLPGLPWFCDGACAVSSVTVSVKPVLPERSRDEWRKSGHERFHRIRFHDKSSGDVVSLRPEARCAVVEFMRDRYAGHLGLAPEELFVGRVCDASTMGVAAHATEEMLNWHYDRVGLDGIAPMSESLVDVALLDGGIDTALHSSLGVARAFDFSSDVSGEFHPHGAAMASFIRDLAPSAALFDLRVLDAGGAGTPADVAQAFDFALFELREEGRALIVNMSLGWAPELGDHAQLTGPDCSTYEDPIGEPLRYLMYGSSETSGLSVFSAAGNQPTDVNAGVFPPASNGPVSASCGAGPQTDWFYPARWSSEPSCTATDPSGRTFGAAISGVDDVEDPIATAIPGEEATLVAPGQHVYAQIAGAPAAPEFPSCAAPATNPGFQNPMALTGTSVATALTSGIAARVQSRMREKSLAPLRTDALNRVLYAAGEDLCRVSVLGEPVRRLHAGRLERLLSDEVSCRNALDCVVNQGGAPGGATLSACGADLGSCLGADQCQSGHSVSWPEGYPSDSQLCQHVTAPTSFSNVSSCSGGSCPFESKPYRTIMGTNGPQPSGGGCLDCWSSRNANMMMLMMDETSGGVEHSDAFVVVSGYDLSSNQDETHYAPLSVGVMHAGESLAVDVPFSSLQMDWSTVDVSLVTTVTADGKDATHIAPVRLSY